MRSQFWDLDFTQGASHDPGPGIFWAHDFQDMDGEPGDLTVAEGHGYPLVLINAGTLVPRVANWLPKFNSILFSSLGANISP